MVRNRGRRGSPVLHVDLQELGEVDELWEKLLEGGGSEQQCGWVKDKYGLSWQIIPTILEELMQDEDAEKAKRVTEAMLQMVKIEIEGLKKAHEGR